MDVLLSQQPAVILAQLQLLQQSTSLPREHVRLPVPQVLIQTLKDNTVRVAMPHVLHVLLQEIQTVLLLLDATQVSINSLHPLQVVVSVRALRTTTTTPMMSLIHANLVTRTAKCVLVQQTQRALNVPQDTSFLHRPPV